MDSHRLGRLGRKVFDGQVEKMESNVESKPAKCLQQKNWRRGRDSNPGGMSIWDSHLPVVGVESQIRSQVSNFVYNEAVA